MNMVTDIFKWVFLFLLLLVLQSTVAPLISIFGVRPDLMIIFIFLVSIHYGQLPAIWVGFAAGMLIDVYSPSLMGQTALGLSISAALWGVFNKKYMTTDILIELTLLFLGTLLFGTVYIASAAAVVGANINLSLSQFFVKTLPTGLYTTVVYLLFYISSNVIYSYIKR